MPGWRNGRREGLKPPWAEKARVGSNPTPGTKCALFDIGSGEDVEPGPVGGGGERNRTRAPR